MATVMFCNCIRGRSRRPVEGIGWGLCISDIVFACCVGWELPVDGEDGDIVWVLEYLLERLAV
jgi:hypothetical protein